jgi:hypothetical protein
MSKLQGTTKLNSKQVEKKSDNNLGLVKKKKVEAVTKTFRLFNDDIKNLKLVKQKVNEQSRTNISESQIIKSLLNIGTKLDPKKILQSLGEML